MKGKWIDGNTTTLGDFVEELVALLHKDGVKIPFKNQRPWHRLFYALKSESSPGKPTFFDQLFFDWDGPYPKSEELSEFLYALHWNTSVSAANPHFETISLTDDVAGLLLKRLIGQDPQSKEFLEEAARRARAEFEQYGGARELKEPTRIKIKFEDYKLAHKAMFGMNDRDIWEQLKDGEEIDLELFRVWFHWLYTLSIRPSMPGSSNGKMCARLAQHRGSSPRPGTTPGWFRTR